MTCKELMNKIIDEEHMNKTEFSKSFDESCASGDKLKVINLLVEHFQCDFEEAHHICEYFIDHTPLPSELTQQQIQKVNQEAQDLLGKPTCPICGSTNLTKISTMGKAAKVGFFGILGVGDLGKTWKCKHCGSKF